MCAAAGPVLGCPPATGAAAAGGGLEPGGPGRCAAATCEGESLKGWEWERVKFLRPGVPGVQQTGDDKVQLQVKGLVYAKG
jgi:hypothetical protein